MNLRWQTKHFVFDCLHENHFNINEVFIYENVFPNDVLLVDHSGQVIVRTAKKKVEDCWFSLANHKIAVQAWPCESSNLFVSLYTVKGKAKPSWKHLQSLENYYVVPTRSTGPLHAILTKALKPDAPVRVGVQYYVAGAPVKVLDWQVQHGFAGVRETELALLKKELGIKDHVASNGTTTETNFILN